MHRDSDDSLIARYEATLSVSGGNLVVADAKAEGEVDNHGPEDTWSLDYLLQAGTYPLESLSTPAPAADP